MANVKMNEVDAYRITAFESDFRASDDMSDWSRHQAWEHAFYLLWEKSNIWECCYSIQLHHRGRYEGYAVEMYVSPDYYPAMKWYMEELGYENIDIDHAKVGIIEEEEQNLSVEICVQTFNGHVLY